MSDFSFSGFARFDASELVGGMEDAAEASGDLADETEDTADSFSALEDVDFETIAAGVGTAGLAGAAQNALDNTQPLREEIGRVSEAVAPTAEEVQNLVTSLSNETFSQGDAAATLSNLAELGIESEDKLEDLALTSDTLADATGTTAEKVSGDLMPALRAMGEDPENLEEHMDLLSTLSNETSLSMDDFSRIARKNAEELGELGLGVEDTAAVMAELEARGLDSRTATRELRQAANDAEGDQQAFMESLDLTEETLNEQQTALENSGASAEDYASAANESFSASDKLSAVIDDLTLKFSGIIQPISALLPALTAGGAALAGLGSIGVTASGVLGALGTAAAALTGPIGLVALGLAGLVALFGDDLYPIAEDVVSFVIDEFVPAATELAEDGFEFLVEKGEELQEWFDDSFGGDIQDVTEEAGETLDSVIDDVGAALDWGSGKVEEFTDTYSDELETLQRIGEGAFDALEIIFETGIDNAIEVVSIGLSVLRGDWDGALEGIKQIGENTWDGIKKLFENALDTINDITDGGVDDVRDTLADLSAWASNTWDFFASLTQPFRDAYDAIVGNSIIPDLKADVTAELNALRDFVASVWDLHPLSDTFEAVADRVTGGDSSVIPTMASDVKSSLNGVNSWIDSTFGVNLKNGLSTAFERGTDAVIDSFGPFDFSPLADGLDGFGDKLEDLIEGLNTLSGVNIDIDIPSFDSLLDGAKSIVRGRSSGRSSSGSSGRTDDNISRGESGGSTGVRGERGDTPDEVSGSGSSSDWNHGTPGATWGLASGGIVTDATRAIVGEGSESEAVMPLSKLEQFVDRPSGGLTIETLTVNASGRREGREAGQALKRELKRFDV